MVRSLLHATREGAARLETVAETTTDPAIQALAVLVLATLLVLLALLALLALPEVRVRRVVLVVLGLLAALAALALPVILEAAKITIRDTATVRGETTPTTPEKAKAEGQSEE